MTWKNFRIIGIAALVAALLGGGVATAKSLIRGSDIKNGTITAKDIKARSISLNRLSRGTQKLIKEAGGAGTNGAQGPKGDTGATGAKGATGAAGAKGDKGDKGEPGTSGTAGEKLVRVTSLTSGPWSALGATDGGANGPAPTPVLKPGIAQLGPYADGQQYARVITTTLAGKTLKSLSTLKYLASYTQDPDRRSDLPFLRVTTADDIHIVFTPNTQIGTQIESGRPQEFDVLAGSVRYDNDAGGLPGNPDTSWDKLIAAHGDEKIKNILVGSGNGAASANSTGYVDTVTLGTDGGTPTRYDFGE